MDTQIVILAAGKGTRMGGEIPKVLIPLDDRPVISYLLDNIKEFFQDLKPIIVVGFEKELVMSTLGSEYVYVTQFDQKGTAHAVMSARPVVTSENIVVLNGDMPFITARSLQDLHAKHIAGGGKVSMFTCTVPNFEGEYESFNGFGRIVRSVDGQINKIVEYKDASEEQKLITEVNTGEYVFDSVWLWEHLKRVNSNNAQGEFYLTDVVELAVSEGEPVLSVNISPQEVYGINTPDHLRHAKTIVDQK